MNATVRFPFRIILNSSVCFRWKLPRSELTHTSQAIIFMPDSKSMASPSAHEILHQFLRVVRQGRINTSTDPVAGSFITVSRVRQVDNDDLH